MSRRGGSKVKSTDSAYREARFESQHPHAVSQPAPAPGPEDLLPSLFWSTQAPGMQVIHKHTCKQTLIHTK